MFVGEAINGIIGPIFETTWSSLKARYHEGIKNTEQEQKRIKAKDAIAQASANYHQNYLDRHCNIKVLPGLMKEGMALDSIYTAVKFLKDSDLRYFSTLDDLEELYRAAGNRRFRVGKNKRQDGLTAANNEQYLMVLGGPGVGKSTFLRKLGLESLENRLDHDLVPVFIELKSFKSKEISLQQAIAKELEVSGFPYAESLVKSMLLDGKMLVLFEGLDEVPSTRMDIVIEQIKDFCDQYQQNRFVISCRVAAYKGGFNRFIDVTMAEFDDEQIEQFVRQWFSSELDKESGTAERFWDLINRPKNFSSKELAQTPLLLTFLCLVYDRSQELPPVRSDLYGDALNILLKDWAAEKRLKQDPIYEGFHAGLEKVLLSEIAYNSFKADQLFFSEQNITKRITEFLADTLEAPKHLDGMAVLDAIKVQQGILIERAKNAYSFSHLTLQEYLVARYVSSQLLVEEMVREYLTDKRWREVFLLVSGLLEGRSHELFLMMESQANTCVSSLKLQGLLQWVMDLSGTSPTANTLLAARAWLLASSIAVASNLNSNIPISMANSFSLHSINLLSITSIIATGRASHIASPQALVSGSVNDIDSNITAIASDIDYKIIAMAMITSLSLTSAIASASARAIASASASASASSVDCESLSTKLKDLREQIPSNKATSDEWQNFTDQLLETFLIFFCLDRELISFSRTEAQDLEKYLYATKLIIDCKNAAVRVSRKEWEAIESRLLTVPGGEVA